MRFLNIISVSAVLVSIGCSSRLPTRGHGEVSSGPIAALVSSKSAYATVNHSSIERHEKFVLGIVEFLGSGKPADSAQLTNAVRLAEEAAPDTVFVVFVHGWDHNADARDPHIMKFRETLTLLAGDVKPRALVGIYVSWPAKPLRGWLNKMTFLDRSKVSHDVSLSCGVRGAFDMLRDAVQTNRAKRKDRSALVLVGHSLGGKFLFTPLEGALEGNRRRCGGDEARAVSKAVTTISDLPLWGDFTLLVNPAQDVHDYELFQEFSETHPNKSGAVLTIISSESDMVVGRMFRWGRTVRNLLPTHWSEFQSERTGLGWRSDQITHRLCFASMTQRDAAPPLGDEGVCTEKWNIEYTRDYGPLQLQSRVPETRPFTLIRTDGRVLERHSGMFDPDFVEFTRKYIAERLRAISGDR